MQLIRNQLGLHGDVKNENLLKIMSFYARTTGSIISKNDTALRHKVAATHRAKAKKHFIEKHPPSEAEQAEAAIKLNNKIQN